MMKIGTDVIDDELYSVADVERLFGISPGALLQRAGDAGRPRILLCIPSPHEGQIRTVDRSPAGQEKFPQITYSRPSHPPTIYVPKLNPIRLLDDPELRCIGLVISREVCNMLRQTRHASVDLFEAIYGSGDWSDAHVSSGYGLIFPYRNYVDAYERKRSTPSEWYFAVYPKDMLFRVNQDFEGSQPEKFEIGPEDVCILGVELQRYIDEARRKAPVLAADQPESMPPVDTHKAVSADKRSKTRRSDLMRLEIAAVHDSLGKKIGELSANEVMKELKRNAGKSGSCVLKEEQDGVRWERSCGGTEILLLKNLQDRLSYSKRTMPERTE